MFAGSLTISSDSPDQTCQLARKFAAQLTGGDVLLLSGDVGAGKTHFARCLIQSMLSEPEDVPSPTYTLIQMYDGPVCEIWHADLYRLSDISEIEELGLLQAFSDAICMVEWPDRLGDLVPPSALSLSLTQGRHEDARTIEIGWTMPHWTERLKGLADA